MLAFALLATLATQDTSAEITITAEAARAQAAQYADCAGLWNYFSGLEAEAGRPASAEHFNNLKNGSVTAALWLHANAHGIEGGKRARYNAWLPLVTPRQEATTLRLRSTAEHGDASVAKALSSNCQAMLDGQQFVIDQLRADSVRDAIED